MSTSAGPLDAVKVAEYLADARAEVAGLTYAHQAVSQAADEVFARLRTKRDQLAAFEAMVESRGTV